MKINQSGNIISSKLEPNPCRCNLAPIYFTRHCETSFDIQNCHQPDVIGFIETPCSPAVSFIRLNQVRKMLLYRFATIAVETPFSTSSLERRMWERYSHLFRATPESLRPHIRLYHTIVPCICCGSCAPCIWGD